MDRSRENSKDEHMHLSDAVLESVMVFRWGAGAVAEVVVPLCLAKAGFLSGCTVVIIIYIYYIYLRYGIIIFRALCPTVL